MEYTDYQELVNKYYEFDNREVNYQNRVIIPFLEDLFGDEYDIVDVSHLTKQWKTINREAFAGDYTPDLLVAKNWNLNQEGGVTPKYLLLIEVKSPSARDRNHAEKEIKEYRQKVDSVILTDCVTWEFFKKEDKIKDIHFEQEMTIKFPKKEYKHPAKVCKRYATDEIEWKKDAEIWKQLRETIKKLVKENI